MEGDIKMGGVINEIVPHIRNYDYELVCGSVQDDFPKEYEIPRENTGTLKDQGNVGACVAETIAQIAESFYKEEMSEGYIYGKFRSDTSFNYGLLVSKAMDLWIEIGTLPKKYFDILEEMPDIKKIVNNIPEFEEISSRYKLKGYTEINYPQPKQDNAIKTALTKYNRGLVAVSRDYFGESHCIVLTGWNDNTDCYKFKNSWGKNYRDNGFGEIPKDEIDYVYAPIFEEITLPFNDVNENDWFYKYVKNMHFAGLISGYDDGTFKPDESITRAEICVIMDRILKKIELNFDVFNKVLQEKINMSK